MAIEAEKEAHFRPAPHPRTDGHKDQREVRTVRFAARACHRERGHVAGIAMRIPTVKTSVRRTLRSYCSGNVSVQPALRRSQRRMTNGREANGPPVRVDVRWTVRDQPHPKCNRHLEWDDTGRLRPCQKVAHWLGVLTPRALSVSAIRWRERWRRALLHAPGRQSGLSRCRIILDPVDRLPSETSGSCDLANA